MKLYLAGIRSYQLDLGTECRAFSDPRLERTIQGIKREHNEPERRNRTPLTRQHLLKILSCLTPNNYEYAMIRASFTLAFAGFLRVAFGFTTAAPIWNLPYLHPKQTPFGME